MSDSSERIPYDYAPSEEEDDGDYACAESSQDLNFRKSAPPSGGVATASSHHYEQSFGFGPKDPPGLDSETSGESIPPSWAGAAGGSTESSRFVPPGKPYSGYGYSAPPTAAAHSQSSYGYGSHHQQGSYSGQPQQHMPLPSEGRGSFNSMMGQPMMGSVSGFTDVKTPGFFAPFGTAGKAATQWSSSYEDDSDSVRAIPFPSTFRLERTNFVVKSVSSSSSGRRLPLSGESLVDALRSSLSAVGVDVLYFRRAHCVLECSSHVGNRFLSIFIRVFRAPDRASGQLFEPAEDAYSQDTVYRGQEDEEDTPYLVEAQLREGDRLHFSALFPEIMREFKNQEGVNIAGTFCYKRRTPPAMGEGLALEEARVKPSRGSFRFLAEREETLKSGGDVLGASSPPPVPASMAKTSIENDDEFEEDMNEDVMVLTKMLRGNYLDVQADAAMAVAGLTADPGFLRRLCRDEASQAASALCFASARLLVETSHRPARRQAAVVVANLSTEGKLCSALLASDPPLAARASSARVVEAHKYAQQRRLVDSLIVLSMGLHDGDGDAARAGNKKEEEIGMRRECMRALVGLAKCDEVRSTRTMKLLLSREPSGRGATDSTLVERLGECREVLKSRP